MRLPAASRTIDKSVKVEKIRWQRLGTEQGVQLLTELQDWIHDVVEAEAELDAGEMWQAFQDVCLLKAKELLGVSKGRLRNGREGWFWKGDSVKKAVAAKRAAFRAWLKCDPLLTIEKERLRQQKVETKKAAAKEIAKAKAAACQKFYEDLESPDGDGMIFKVAAQHRNNAKAITSPKFIEDANGRLLTDDHDITQG
ncbi:uncharacterized protein LOC142317764 [Lycorma delicatula]|uniref:uncharacterized protein LOC142317764 n=1 Tax=Lycorma delicatula TaxID=130591 RepID=UPI003F512A26